MAWHRPLRSALAAGEGLLDRALCVAGALVFSQVPEFLQQYLQRLGGHLDEARRQLEQFRGAAALSGVSVDQLAANAGRSPDPGIARLGGVVGEAAGRVAELGAQERAIRDAPVLLRPFVFIRRAEGDIVRATWHAFRPALPTTGEGLYYAVLGMIVFLGCYHGAVRVPVRRAWSRRRLAAAAALAAAAMALAAPARAQPATLRESEVKALYIFHFTQFVEWPSSAFPDPQAPLCIGVAGDDGLEEVLIRIVRGERMGPRPLEVRAVRTAAEAADCQIVYLAPGRERMAARIRGRPVLTVGETDAFVRDGGIIRFSPERAHLRFRINLLAARDATLNISAKLLRLADLNTGAPR